MQEWNNYACLCNMHANIYYNKECYILFVYFKDDSLV